MEHVFLLIPALATVDILEINVNYQFALGRILQIQVLAQEMELVCLQIPVLVILDTQETNVN
jgi:hypothetical protein